MKFTLNQIKIVENCFYKKYKKYFIRLETCLFRK